MTGVPGLANLASSFKAELLIEKLCRIALPHFKQQAMRAAIAGRIGKSGQQLQP